MRVAVASSAEAWRQQFAPTWSPLRRSLPGDVHLLDVKVREHTKAALGVRLQRLPPPPSAAGSGTVEVDLSTLFAAITSDAPRETTPDFNVAKDDVSRLQWRCNGCPSNDNEQHTATTAGVVQLTPSSMRSFVLANTTGV